MGFEDWAEVARLSRERTAPVWVQHPIYRGDLVLYGPTGLLIGEVGEDDVNATRGAPCVRGDGSTLWGWTVGRHSEVVVAEGVCATREDAQRMAQVVADAVGFSGLDADNVPHWRAL